MRLKQEGVKIITCGLPTKRLNLLYNNSAQVLTRQDVQYCSEQELDCTFQFYQASLLIARS